MLNNLDKNITGFSLGVTNSVKLSTLEIIYSNAWNMLHRKVHKGKDLSDALPIQNGLKQDALL
jgi:hypothetical protein